MFGGMVGYLGDCLVVGCEFFCGCWLYVFFYGVVDYVVEVCVVEFGEYVYCVE